MALPAIIGLSALGSLITSLITKAFDFFLSKTFKKIAVFTVIIGLIYAAVMTLLSFVGSQIKPLLSALPPEVMSFFSAALPSNTTSCLSAIVATYIACMTYKLTLKSLDIQARVVE